MSGKGRRHEILQSGVSSEEKRMLQLGDGGNRALRKGGDQESRPIFNRLRRTGEPLPEAYR